MEKAIVFGATGGTEAAITEVLVKREVQTNIEVDRNAQVIVDLSIEIEAPQETVWRIQTGIDQWPTWQKNVSQSRLSGPIAEGSTFMWETHGIPIVSTILEVDPMRRIVWGGTSARHRGHPRMDHHSHRRRSRRAHN